MSAKHCSGMKHGCTVATPATSPVSYDHEGVRA